MSKKGIAASIAVAIIVSCAAVLVWRQKEKSSGPSLVAEPIASVDTGVARNALLDASDREVKRSSVLAIKTSLESMRGVSSETALTEAQVFSRCVRTGGGKRISMPEGLTVAQRQQLLASSGLLDMKCPEVVDSYRVYALAEHAAELGNLQAQLDFPVLVEGVFRLQEAKLDTELIAKFKRDSMRFLEMARRAGSAEALLRLSENYDAGLLVDKDPLRAYAYCYAWGQRSPSPIAAQRLATLGRSLSPSQILQAQQAAQALLESSGTKEGMQK